MKSVRIDKARLVETLQANRTKHVEEYTEALDGYYDLAERKVQRLLGRVLARTDEGNLYINLIRPTSYEEEYETALQMLEWSEDDTVELTQQEFKQYVQDEWQWKNNFVTTNSTYIG